MKSGCQYGEEKIILPFFKNKRNGLVVEVGAADGEEFSNSRFLIRDYGWRGILIEPEPEQFARLKVLYDDDPSVVVIQSACGLRSGLIDFYPARTGSTALPEWRDLVQQLGHEKVGPTIKVFCDTLDRLLFNVNCPREIDFLSVDCEGMDLEVLKSMSWASYHVGLVCTEVGTSLPSGVVQLMEEVGFSYHARTNGNGFWRNNRGCP
jgi:FkbM family methyltransferase